MRRETHNRPAANQAFKERLDKFKRHFPDVSPDAFMGLDRIARDPRGTEAWSLIASHPEKADIFFFQIVEAFWKSEKDEGQRFRESMRGIHITQNDIEDAISACEFLIRFCLERSTSFASPLRARMPIWRELANIKDALEAERRFVIDMLADDDEHLPHRPSAVFIMALSTATQKIFGQPHDGVVAAVASVLFDADIDPLAIKMARSRARRRKPWDRPFSSA